MRAVIRTVLTVGMVAFALAAGPASADYKIGVLAKRGAPETMREWGATAAYLSEKLGEKFQVVPLKFDAVEPAIQAGHVDFLLANSGFYVGLQEKYQIYAIATMANARNGQALNSFGGVIFARADGPIHELADIKGKKFMGVKYSSFGGAQMAWYLLLQNGIDPRKDCASFLEGGTHDNVVLAVKNGVIDAGTVRSDTLERMQDEGKINMSEFRIIHRVQDDFPFAHSTPLYPEWPMAALVKTDKALAKRVEEALLAMPKDSPAAQAAKVAGWTPPADYASVKSLVSALQAQGIKAGE